MINKKYEITLDIIVPSYRADLEVLSSIINLNVPDRIIRKLIIIFDNPNQEISVEMSNFLRLSDVIFVQNKENLGASKSRNVGINTSKSDWILFLDDDIQPSTDLLDVYLESISKHGDEVPGFVGVTMFPPPMNNFTKGIIASQILTFFDLAKKVEQMPWGITANLLVNRDAIGDIRFSDIFPKAGGGEDIDFCLEVCKSHGSQFSSESRAIVTHPWWFDGKRSYKRFFRWAYGDSRLPSLHNEHKYRNLPNSAESLFLLLLTFVLLFSFSISIVNQLPIIVIAIFLGDWITEYLKISFNSRNYNPIIAIESSLIRFSNDLGRLIASIESLNFLRITQRFDYAATGKWISGERKWAATRIFIQMGFIYYMLER
jgi:GT2 family glycosyltransferase|tara:strand:- start:579 stop:1697 length:1119 start_codon:yes stop_codon:yes gene_type:complete